jgi:Ferritin-like domain
MAEGLDLVYQTIDEQHAGESAHTRRKLVAGAATALGGMGLLGFAQSAMAADPGTKSSFSKNNTPERILAIAATAEVLATIVNTVGAERGLGGDKVTQRNIRAAAREELIHYYTLTGPLGAKAVTKKIWVPDAVFANRTSFLSTLEVGDQIFVNAYLIGTVAFGYAGMGQEAALAAEFMGVEAVHRALARQSLGKLGNDRVFIRFDQPERAPDAPNRGQYGFQDITGAVKQLQAAGFGFGEPGKGPGRFYDFDEVRRRTPDDPDVNTRTLDPLD